MIVHGKIIDKVICSGRMKILFIGARLFDDVAAYAKEKGITTILTESNPNSPNLGLADDYYIVSRGMKDPKEIAIKEDVDAVVPLIGVDEPLIEVARMKDELETTYDLPVIASGVEAATISTDKLKTKEFLIENHIDTPEFIKMSKEQYFNFELDFPIVLKQSKGQGGAGLKVASSWDDVDVYFEVFDQAIAEEFIHGAEISIEVLRWDGKSVALVPVYKGDTTIKGIHPLNKIRTAPVNIESLDNQNLRKLAKGIVDDLGACGTTEVEFIFDKKIQKINVIEMNTRPSGTRYLALASSDVNPMHQLVNMAISKWKPRKIQRFMKQYAALEMPIGTHKYLQKSKVPIFTQNNSWIIHGPEDAQRITIRAKTTKRAFEIAKKLKIME